MIQEIKFNNKNINNFRDFGGYMTESSQRVKTKIFYRSGALAYIDSQEDLDIFKYLAKSLTINMLPSSENEIKLSTHEGEEFIYVLEGEVEIKYGKETYQLKAGDSIYYESIVAHHVHSFGSEKAKILAIVYTPA